MYTFNAIVTIDHCIFLENSLLSVFPQGFGGAVYADVLSELTFENCWFKGNAAANDASGGAVNSNEATSMTFSSCLFEENTAGFGGAVFQDDAVTVGFYENCIFRNNSTAIGAGSGGAVNTLLGMTDYVNCLFHDNVSDFGGAINYQQTSPAGSIVNCTFANNDARVGPLGGGGIDNNNSSPTVVNTILWGNTAGGGTTSEQQILDFGTSASTVTF